MNYYRSKAIEEKGAVCENCGSTDEIEVHHVDKNRCNNSLDNLIVLCKDCHTTVHRGWPEKGTLLRELMVNTGIKVPDPVYNAATREAERRDVSRGAVIEDWCRKAEKYDEMEARR